MDRYERSEALIGKDGITKLKMSRVALFGLGGVGGYTLEILARSCVGSFILVDHDIFDKTNLNRQLLSFEYNIGTYKTDEAKKYVLSIDSTAEVETFNIKVTEMNDLSFIDDKKIDFIIDAIDHIQGKISLIKYAIKRDIPHISCMGTGNRLDPCKLVLCDISKTSTCPVARKVRHALKREGIEGLRVVCSTEIPITHGCDFVGSMAAVPAAAGIMLASEAINVIISGSR